MLPLKSPTASKLGLKGLKFNDLTEECVCISQCDSNDLSFRLNLLIKATEPVGPIASHPFRFQSTSKITLSSSSYSCQSILFLAVSISFILPADVTITQYLLMSSSLTLGLIGHQTKDCIIRSAPFECRSSNIFNI